MPDAAAIAALPISVGIYNTTTDQLVGEVTDGAAFFADVLAGNLTISVDVLDGGALDGLVGSVRLRLTGGVSKTMVENVAPYALFGDTNGDFKKGKPFGPGDYTLVVELYAGKNGNGVLRDGFTSVSDGQDIGPVGHADPAVDAIAEDTAEGAVVGITALASDPDAADDVSYARFAIEADGVVTVAAGAAFDFESEPEITLEVTRPPRTAAPRARASPWRSAMSTRSTSAR